MKNFVFGVAVGAVGMGLYTGHIRIDLIGKTPPPFVRPEA